MQGTPTDKQIPRLFIGVFLITGGLLGWMVFPFISTIIMGLVVTGIFSPVYRFFLNRIRPGLASLITCLLIFIVLFVPIILMGGILSSEAYDLLQRVRGSAMNEQINTLLEKSSIIERTNNLLSRFDIEITREEFKQQVTQIGIGVGRFLVEQTQTIATNILTFLVNFFFMLMIVYFLLIDGDKFIRFVKDLSPLTDAHNDQLFHQFKDMAGAILLGNGFCGMIQGILGGSVFAIFGFNSPVLWGIVMAFLAFLPILGIGLVFVPSAVYLFITDQIGAGIFFIVFYVVLSGGIEYLFKPRLVGGRVHMHTLLVFLSMIGGLKLFGLLGIIYGPIVLTAFLSLAEIYRSTYLKASV